MKLVYQCPSLDIIYSIDKNNINFVYNLDETVAYESKEYHLDHLTFRSFIEMPNGFEVSVHLISRIHLL